MINLLGIAGRAGSGKDTFYRLIAAKHGFHRIAFADPVRMWAANDLDVMQLGSLISLKKTPEVRTALQQAGMKGRDEIDPGLWIYLALQAAWEYIEEGIPVAITDTRFLNEAAVIRGEREVMEAMYDRYTGPTNAAVRKALTTYRSEGGLLPARMEGEVVKLVRDTKGVLSLAQEKDRSELEVDLIPSRFEIDNTGDLDRLLLTGDALMARLGYGYGQRLAA